MRPERACCCSRPPAHSPPPVMAEFESFWDAPQPGLRATEQGVTLTLRLLKPETRALHELTRGRDCRVCTPSHFATGRVTDFMLQAEFRSMPDCQSYTRYDDLGRCVGLRVETVKAGGQEFTIIQRFEQVECMVPPDDIQFRQHLALVGRKMPMSDLDRIVAFHSASYTTEHRERARFANMTVMTEAAFSSGLTVRYVIGYHFFDMDNSVTYEDVDIPFALVASRAAYESAMQSAADRLEQDEDDSILILDGAADDRTSRDSQRAQLRTKLAEAKSRRRRG